MTLLGGSLIPFDEFCYRDAASAGGVGRAAGLACFVGWFSRVLRGRPHLIHLFNNLLLRFSILPAVLSRFLLQLLHIAGDEMPSQIRDDAGAYGCDGHHWELLQQGINRREDLGF